MTVSRQTLGRIIESAHIMPADPSGRMRALKGQVTRSTNQ